MKTKNPITSEVVRNYFTSTTTREDARAVEELLNNVISGLIAKEEAADSIPAIEDICASLKDEHGIDLPESFAADYLYKYVESNHPHLFANGSDTNEMQCVCGEIHTVTEHMLSGLNAMIAELEDLLKTSGTPSEQDECPICDIIAGSIRGYELAASLGKLKRIEAV